MLAYTAQAGACSCGPNPPPLDALEEADAVFIGVVERVEAPPPWRYIHSDGSVSMLVSGGDLVRYSFRVTHAWKGVLIDTVSVYSQREGPACGFKFSKGEQYVVYARVIEGWRLHDGEGSPILPSVLHTGLCTRTRLLADGLADRYKLPPPADFMSPTALPEITVASILKQLEDEDDWTRGRAARALGEIGEEMELVVPALVKLLASRDSSDRAAAARALGDLGPRARAAAPALRKVLRDKLTNDSIRYAAERALESMGVEQ